MQGDGAKAIFNSAVQATAYAVAAVCASRCMRTIIEMHPQSDRSHDGADATVRPRRHGSVQIRARGMCVRVGLRRRAGYAGLRTRALLC